MSPAEITRRAASRIIRPPSVPELLTHAAIVLTVVICATFLGIHKDLNSGDLLAVFTAALTGTAAVAGARAGNRQMRSTDDDPANGR